MARVCNGNVADTYSTLVNPGIKISDRIIELTHIHNEELTDKPRINELIDDVIQFIGDYPILTFTHYIQKQEMLPKSDS